MADQVYPHDPNKVLMTFKGINIVGVAEGTYVAVERAADGKTMKVGSQGDVAVTKNRNRTGSVTFTLMEGSPTNADLSKVYNDDENDVADGNGSLMITDLNGTTVYKASTAWIRKLPKGEHGNESGNREWVIDCAKLLMVVGGSSTTA